jgi:hypothetical protein
MKKQFCLFIHIIVAGAFAAVFSGCISVNLPSASGQKATSVTLQPPANPYSEIKGKNTDQTWLSSKTGNTISYISDCNNPSDPSLQQIESETLNVLGNLKIISSETPIYNGRIALQTVAQGEVDGVPVKMRMMTVKKNGCNYSLIYAGVSEKFAAEIQQFDGFLKGFKAP